VAWSNHKDASTGAILPWNQQMLVFSQGDATSPYGNLYVRKPDGTGSVVPITNCGYSSDGTQVTSADNPTWLPDAPGSTTTRINYTYKIYAKNSSGVFTLQSTAFRVTTLNWSDLTIASDQPLSSVNSLPAGVNPPSALVWDRKAGQILWEKGSNLGFWLAQIVGVDANGNPIVDWSSARSLTSGGRYGSFSPDGTQISFLNTPSGSTIANIYRIKTDNTGLATVYNNSKIGVYFACWGP
jgi:hypothetical protein